MLGNQQRSKVGKDVLPLAIPFSAVFIKARGWNINTCLFSSVCLERTGSMGCSVPDISQFNNIAVRALHWTNYAMVHKSIFGIFVLTFLVTFLVDMYPNTDVSKLMMTEI